MIPWKPVRRQALVYILVITLAFIGITCAPWWMGQILELPVAEDRVRVAKVLQWFVFFVIAMGLMSAKDMVDLRGLLLGWPKQSTIKLCESLDKLSSWMREGGRYEDYRD